MRSIRRSVLGYLLLLLAVSLGAVGALVDRFANGAVRQREASERERIEQAFKVQQSEAKAKLDADLQNDAKQLAVEVYRQTRSLLGQNVEYRPPTASKKGQDIPPVLKPTEEEARQYRIRSAMMEFSPVPGFLPALVPIAAMEPGLRGSSNRNFFPYPYPNWVDYEGPKAITRIQETLQREFADDPRTSRFQFSFALNTPGKPSRVVAVARCNRLPPGTDLPVEPEFLEPAGNREPKLQDVNIPNVGLCRKVVTSSLPNGRPIAFFVWLPPPPAPYAYPNHTVFRTNRAPDLVLRIVVHTVRPYSELNDRVAVEQKERDEQLMRVDTETRLELDRLRSRLMIIGGGTFAALVLGGWFFVSRGLSPLHKLSDAVSRVSEKDFRLPVVAAELGRELAPIHERLTQTLTLLQRAFAREKQAVADISHELRTPIASLLATIDVALRKPRTSDQYRTALEECRLISKQLGQLVERIMTLASLDAGNDHTLISRTLISELTAGCAAVIRPLAAANNISISVRQDDDLVLETDSAKLREVLMNLLHNAVEYNKPGGTIELIVRRDDSSAIFEVRDTGIGMTPDVEEKIFERFYRADTSRHATGVHAGLGLAIVKEYIQRLHGTIAVESEPGVGTTFRVTLPVLQTLANGVATATSAPAAAETPTPAIAVSDRTKSRGPAVPTGT